MKRIAGVLTGVVSLVLLLAAPAFAQYPATEATCGVSDTTLGPGDHLTVSGDNWESGSTVRFTLQPEGASLGSAKVGPDGSFSAAVTIPGNVSTGSHTIDCSGTDANGNTQVLGTNISISGAAGGGTAFTGANISLGLILLAGLFLAGVVALVAGRRRSKVAARK